MASNSRWGISFLEKAVNSVESRLDTILADGDEAPAQANSSSEASKDKLTTPTTASSHTRQNSLSRSSSTKPNDRLQERLARAMAAKQAGNTRTASPASSAAPPSRTTTPLPADESPRPSFDESRGSFDGAQKPSVELERPGVLSSRASEDLRRTSIDINRPGAVSETIIVNPPSRPSSIHGSPFLSPTRSSFESGRALSVSAAGDEKEEVQTGGNTATSGPAHDYEGALRKLQEEHEESEKKWQEEMHGYVERIDALQSKLQYLTKEAAESAKKSASTAPSGSLEKKLLERDEKIALLMEEGQNLSKTELKHMTLIKKLRAQAGETSKAQTELKLRAEKAERDLLQANERAKRAEDAEKRAASGQGTRNKAERDLQALTNERTALNATVADIKAQLSRANARAEAAEAKAQADAAEIEKRHAQEVKDELASAKIEREISEEKLRKEIRDLKEAKEREKEKARALEVELRGEQSVLESKMETLRIRAEEVSSGATGDAQAKLLRQIETLQTQYAVASENWQGIEGSLLARLANVEKERDEIARREGDLRKKGREVNLKARKAEAELDSARETIQDLERKSALQDTEMQKLEQLEQELSSAKEDFSRQKEVWEANLAQRIEEERHKILSNRSHSRLESPVASSRKGPTTLNVLPRLNRQVSHNSIESLVETGMARRASHNPSIHSPDFNTPSRQNSGHSLSQMNGNGHFSPLETPSISTTDLTEVDPFFNNGPEDRASQHGGTAVGSGSVNELLSISTVAAGPSVQLVERMSATVRRLESERSASKDELARLTAQRDEARKEVVELMREAEASRGLQAKVTELEAEVAGLDSRYQAALEMAGEKSEEVEELRNDVMDLKKIYRELVESTLK